MTRFLIRLALPFLALFTATIGLIRARPYDDHGLRDLLLPLDCPAPCFMGIRPGVTTLEEAQSMLENISWVGTIWQQEETYNEFDPPGTHISLEWNWANNSLFDPEFRYLNLHYNGVVSTVYSGVMSISAAIPFRLGDVWLALGEPDGFVYDSFLDESAANPYNPIYFRYSFAYPFHQMIIEPLFMCYKPSSIWNSPLYFTKMMEIDTNRFKPIDEWMPEMRKAFSGQFRSVSRPHCD